MAGFRSFDLFNAEFTPAKRCRRVLKNSQEVEAGGDGGGGGVADFPREIKGVERGAA